VIDKLANFAMNCIPLLKECFHMESLVMQWALHSFDKVSPSYLGGKEGISMSINVSHNFANSCHYDSLDYRPSIVLWVMDNDAWKIFDQYLVFNNVVQTMDGKDVRHGLLIKISNGMIMSFQGNTLQHGTTIRCDAITGKLCPKGNIYGIHFGLSLPKLNSFHCVRIDQYIREMNIIPKMVIHQHLNSIHENKKIICLQKKEKIRLLFRSPKN